MNRPADQEPSIKVVIHGAGGRMGRGLLEHALASPTFVLTGAVEHSEHPDLGTAVVAGAPVLSADLPAALENADVLIDFSLAPAVRSAGLAAADAGVAFVTGTTGLESPPDVILSDVATRIPVLAAPNMSLGVNLLLELTELAARALRKGWDTEIVELHHRHKRDAPSGTALALARSVANGRGGDLEENLNTARDRELPERPDDEIGVFGVRGGDVAGEHTVFFFGEQERIELTHRATDRAIFVRGALTAARWLVGRSPGFYSMQDVLFSDTQASNV